MSSPSLESSLHDAQAQIRDLRRQLDQLIADRVEPALGQAADHASRYAQRAAEMAQDEAETAAEYVRQRPFTTVLAAVALGYIVARLTR